MPAGATISRTERKSTHDANGFEPNGLGALFVRYLLIVLVGLILGLLGAAIYLTATPKEYTAVASLWIDRRASPGSAPSQPGLAAELARTQGQAIRSAAVLAPVMDRLDYESMSIFKGKDDIEPLRQGLSTSVSENGLLYVKLSARGPEDSTRNELTDALDAIVNSYMSYMVQRNDDAAEQVRARLLKDRAVLASELEAAQAALTSWRQQNAESQPEATSASQRATALARALADAERDAARARSVYDEAVARAGSQLTDLSEKQLEDALNLVGEDVDGISRRAELEATRRQLDQLSKTLLPNHPSVVRLQQRVRQLTLVDVATARRNWTQAGQEIAALQKSLDESTRELARADSGSAERLRREEAYRRAAARLDDLDKALSEELLRTRLGDLSVQLVAPAAVDEAREPPIPRASRVVPAAALLGVALALGVGLIGQSRRRDWRPARLAARTETSSAPTKSEAIEQLPLLASLPALPDASVESAAWATQLDPAGNYARAVRVLRQSVEIENRLPATFVFAPIAMGDGATTIASNLAMLLAREGRKIILVDASFGQSSIEQALDLKSSDETETTLGLADALMGAELVSAIRTTSIPGLDAMSAGKLPEQTDSRALFDSPKMGELITHLAAAYDHVIFDAPPIASSDDTRLVAALADATVIVARSGATSRNDLIEARNQLQMLGANVIGLVIRNDSAGRNS